MKIRILAVSILLSTTLSAFSQGGSLTPPGGPNETMKTLDEIEPRVPVIVGADGVSSNATAEFVISKPGSYYLTSNLKVSKSTGISITAPNTILDLNGFQILRSGVGGTGIALTATASQSRIHNGSITGFLNGVDGDATTHSVELSRLTVSTCTSHGIRGGKTWQVSHCSIQSTTGVAGIRLETGAIVSNCTFLDNAHTYDLLVGSGSTISSCTLNDNTSQYGIYAIGDSVITKCAVSGQTGEAAIFTGPGANVSHCTVGTNKLSDGIYIDSGSITHCVVNSTRNDSTVQPVYGIHTGADSTIAHCIVTNTGNADGGAASSHNGIGIRARTNSAVINCTSSGNKGDGIQVRGNGIVRGCLVEGNGTGGEGAGIYVATSNHRIENNHLISNEVGIFVDGPQNVIVGNTVISSDDVNYRIDPGNSFGAIIDNTNDINTTPGVDGNTAQPSTLSSTDPWANFSH